MASRPGDGLALLEGGPDDGPRPPLSPQLVRHRGDEQQAADDLGLGPLGAALGRLSPEHRAVIVMRYLLEYTPGEIADLLEVPRGTVNSRLRRALDRLATELAEEEDS